MATCSDMTRTLCRRPGDCLPSASGCTRAQQRVLRPSGRNHLPGVDRAAREVIRRAGYGEFFGHALGHGVGLAVHEEPRLSSRSRRKLKPGMVVTVEPGIYLPDWAVFGWKIWSLSGRMVARSSMRIPPALISDVRG